MATYRCVGRGVTDSNGVAHLTHDCSGNPLQSSGYVGSGKGQTQFITSLDNPSQINDGSLQSETYSVLDTIAFDNATLSDHNDIWYTNNASVTRGADNTVITATAQWGAIYLGNPTTRTQLNLLNNADKICIEWIGSNVQGINGFNIRYNDGSNRYIGFITGTGLHKAILSKTRVDLYLDNVWKSGWDISTTNAYLQSVASENGMEFNFKDLKIYQI